MDSDLKKRLLWTHAPAVPFTALLAGYFAYQVFVFALSGSYTYHTRTNLGHPFNISFIESPLVFVGLCFIQLSFSACFLGWGMESAYHVLRILKPSLNWPLRPRFKPYRAGIVSFLIGVTLLALGVFYMFAVMLLHK